MYLGRSLLTGSAVYLASNILTASIPFLLLPILTRHLSPEEYGEVAIFQTLVSALIAIVGLSSQGIAVRKYYEGGGEKLIRLCIASCLQILLTTAFVLVACFWVFNQQLAAWLGLDGPWIMLAILVAAANVVVRLRLGQWQVRKLSAIYGGVQVAKGIVDFVLAILFVVVLVSGATGRMSALTLTAIAFAAFSLFSLRRDALLSFRGWNSSLIREALSYGVNLMPHTAGIFLLTAVDRFIINAELGGADVGVYMIAVQFSAALALVFDAVNKAYVPWLFEKLNHGSDTERSVIVRYTYWWYGFLLLCSIAGFFLAPSVVRFIAGDSYGAAGDIVGLLLLGQVFGGMYQVQANYILYSKKTLYLSVSSVFSGATNIVLLLIFIEQFELVGAAYAYCASMILRFFLTWWASNRCHPMPWFKLYGR